MPVLVARRLHVVVDITIDPHDHFLCGSTCLYLVCHQEFVGDNQKQQESAKCALFGDDSALDMDALCTGFERCSACLRAEGLYTIRGEKNENA